MSTLASMEGHAIAPLGAEGAFTRRQLEELIHRAIDALDAMDGDPDIEPEPDGVCWDDDLEPDDDAEASYWPAVVGPQECCAVRIGRAQA